MASRRRARIEVAVVVAACVVAYAVASALELFESFGSWSRQHEELNLDELMVTAVVAMVGTTLIAWRRNRETRRIVTRLRATEAELADALAEATEAGLAREAFVQTVSHEIRTPLSSTLAATEMLAETGLDPQQERLVSTIERGGTRLLALVNQILDFNHVGREQAGAEMVPFELTRLVSELVDDLRPAATRKGLALRHAVDAAVPAWVVGDPGRVGQVLVNLVGNAIKFTDLGWVRVSVGTAHDTGHVVLAVQDTGIGLGPADQERIFEPFHQVDASITRRHEGTGLGLAISSTMIAAMGGRIWVDSEPGRGSTFSVSLPLPAAERQAS